MGKVDVEKELRELGILIEDVISQNNRILEGISVMKNHVEEVPELQENIQVVKNDIKAVKAAITDLSHQTSGHASRLSRLESNPA